MDFGTKALECQTGTVRPHLWHSPSKVREESYVLPLLNSERQEQAEYDRTLSNQLVARVPSH